MPAMSTLTARLTASERSAGSTAAAACDGLAVPARSPPKSSGTGAANIAARARAAVDSPEQSRGLERRARR
jgi:hypothetical protein